MKAPELSSFYDMQSWHHRKFMARLPPLPEPSFDPAPFERSIFEVWPADDVTRSGPPMMCVLPAPLRSYGAIQRLLSQHQARFAGLLTAWNPGRVETAAFNQAANERLEATLRATDYPVYPARGRAVDGDWYEDSFLVVCDDYETLVGWQKDFEQLAFLLFRTDGTAELRW